MPGIEQRKFNFGPGEEALEEELARRIKKVMERDPGVTEEMARKIVEIAIRQEEREREKKKKKNQKNSFDGTLDPLLK